MKEGWHFIFFIAADGKLGIGTTIPTSKMDVVEGTLRLRDLSGNGARVLAVDSSGIISATGIGLKSGGGGSCNPVIDGWGTVSPVLDRLHLCGTYNSVQIGEQPIANYNNLNNIVLDVHGDLRVGGGVGFNHLAGGNGLHVVFADQNGTLALHPTIGTDPFWGTLGTQVQQGMFIGSTNNEDLLFKTNNVPRLHLSRLGKLTVADLAGSTNAPNDPVMVDASGQLLRGNGGAYWAIGGNNGANGQVLGTLTGHPLRFVTNGALGARMEIAAGGEVAFNSAPIGDYMLNVEARQNTVIAIRARSHVSPGGTYPYCIQAVANTDGTKAFSVWNEAITGNGCNGEEVFRVWGDGRVEAKRVKIFVNGWCVYVFGKDYALRPLEDVNAYIQAHGHLPEVPSTAEVTQAGVDVGDMEALLLKKVEELTLYAIEQQQRCDVLERQLVELKNKLEAN